MQEFFQMGGYAGYVWSAFGITAAAMIILAMQSRRAERRALEKIRRQEENKR